MNFNSRPRVGGDLPQVSRGKQLGISIHAPVWGATEHPGGGSLPAGDFNSRPRVGGDRTPGRTSARTGYFNSRPRVGGDVEVPKGRGAFIISIHAPVWGATEVPEERKAFMAVFQFTPPCGGRRTGRLDRPPHLNFNSRPRVGGDLYAKGYELAGFISIHAPVWGATERKRCE